MKNFLNIIIGFVGVLAVAGITVASYRAVVNNESKGKHKKTGIARERGVENAYKVLLLILSLLFLCLL